MRCAQRLGTLVPLPRRLRAAATVGHRPAAGPRFLVPVTGVRIPLPQPLHTLSLAPMPAQGSFHVRGGASKASGASGPALGSRGELQGIRAPQRASGASDPTFGSRGGLRGLEGFGPHGGPRGLRPPRRTQGRKNSDVNLGIRRPRTFPSEARKGRLRKHCLSFSSSQFPL